jgi:hypothetical protein
LQEVIERRPQLIHQALDFIIPGIAIKRLA